MWYNISIEFNRKRGRYILKRQQEFKQELDNYYNHLIVRFENGFKYLEANPTDKKAIRTYEDIINEVQHIERLRSLYKEQQKHEA